MEISINEISQKTKLSKKQILTCEKKGLIPSRIRVDKRGRAGGDIIIFDIEAYERLKLICQSPLLKSMRYTIGIEGIAWIIFITRDDDKINECIQNVLLKAFSHFKEQKICKGKNFKDIRLTFFEKLIPPVRLVRLFILKSACNENEFKERFLINESKDYYRFSDNIREWGYCGIKRVIKKLNIERSKEEIAEDVEAFSEMVIKFIATMPSFSEVESIIKSMDENDFYLFRLIMCLVLALISFKIKGKKLIQKLQSSIFNYTIYITCLYCTIFLNRYKTEYGYKFIEPLQQIYDKAIEEINLN